MHRSVFRVRSVSRSFLFLVSWFALAPAASAFYGDGSPDPAVPTPDAYLGYAIGERFTPHHRIVGYLEAIAETSDRVRIVEYGETYEGRPLLYLAVSSPENLSKAEEIRATYARLADPRETSLGEARTISEDLPIAVWLSFNIHGDEASSSEAAMALVYRLAAARDPETLALLEQAVVLVDPCLNPDGRDRYVDWIRTVLGQNPNPLPAAREHNPPWPGGRFNHYLFDLNRDWAWLTQRESRARAAAYLSWRPQVHVDFHEMFPEDTYFFFPAERPIHPNFPPQIVKWGDIFGRGNAAAFDARGWRYYTAETFDLYYPGYGDTWPTFHGAIGMTYEQAGHGWAGISFSREDGDTLMLRARAEHHYTAALTTVKTAVEHREARLLDFYRFFETDTAEPRAYLFPPGNDPPRTAELIELLMTHGAEVFRSSGVMRPSGLHAFDGTPATASLPPGTYVVSMDQPLHRFLRSLLEPEAALPDTLFYDLSAWSLPLAFGVDAYWTNADIRDGIERLEKPPLVSGSVQNRDAGYAFLVSWDRNGAAKAAAHLLAAGVRVHYTTRAFTASGNRFPAGSLVVFRHENPETLVGHLEEAAFTSSVDIVGVDSGLTEEGPDLGSSRVRPLTMPHVAILADDPVSPTSLGSCWFLMDQIYEIPHALLLSEDLTEDALKHFNVLVFPDSWGGSGGAYADAVDSSAVLAIREWVRRGGVFVGMGGGAFFATADHAGLSSVALVKDEDDEDLPEEERETKEEARKRETSAEREIREQKESLPGTIFRVRVDPLHPLGFGYHDDVRVLKISDRSLELGPPGSNVAWFSDSPRVSGYAPDEAVERLAGRPFLVDEPLGSGHVVLYVEDPNYRLFWYGLNRLFLNSLFFLASGD